MERTLANLIEKLEDETLHQANVIPWSSPVPVFGDPLVSTVATLGLNPSNLEFVDKSGGELDGPKRRFHTLKSLALERWSEAKTKHYKLIDASCRQYFSGNPYDGWFKKLDQIVCGAHASYYLGKEKACHLDLVPYATTCKWGQLSGAQKRVLLNASRNMLAPLLRDSAIRVLILNGSGVVQEFQQMFGLELDRKLMDNWSLHRKSGKHVAGFSYEGSVERLSGVELNHKILILGFNHNIQSSHGMRSEVILQIHRWIASSAQRAIG